LPLKLEEYAGTYEISPLTPYFNPLFENNTFLKKILNQNSIVIKANEKTK